MASGGDAQPILQFPQAHRVFRQPPEDPEEPSHTCHWFGAEEIPTPHSLVSGNCGDSKRSAAP